MNELIKKVIVVIIILCFPFTIFSQKSVDGKYLFKMWFYIEHINQNFRTENDFPSKDSTLFSLFESAINLNFDTLKSKCFSSDYVFLLIAPLKENIVENKSSITYNKTNKLGFISVPVNNCNGYVLCINTISGRSYRLQGFYGNDLLSLFQEIRENYKKINSTSLSVESFLKHYIVEGLDLNCIYHGLTSREQDKEKYPCLLNCSDFVVIIH